MRSLSHSNTVTTAYWVNVPISTSDSKSALSRLNGGCLSFSPLHRASSFIEGSATTRFALKTILQSPVYVVRIQPMKGSFCCQCASHLHPGKSWHSQLQETNCFWRCISVNVHSLSYLTTVILSQGTESMYRYRLQARTVHSPI